MPKARRKGCRARATPTFTTLLPRSARHPPLHREGKDRDGSLRSAPSRIGLPQKDAVFLWDIRKGARDGDCRTSVISPPFPCCLSVKIRLKRQSVCKFWLQKNRQAGLSVFLFRNALAWNGAFCPCRLMSQRLTQSRTHSVHAVGCYSQHRRQGCIPPSAAQNGAEEGGRVARSVPSRCGSVPHSAPRNPSRGGDVLRYSSLFSSSSFPR